MATETSSDTTIIEGALVRWRHSDPPVLGRVLPAPSAREVRVKWDDPEAPPRFARDAAPDQLERVSLFPGMQVRRASDDQPGVVLGEVPGERPRWRVLFLSSPGSPTVVLEGDLRPDDALDPAGRMKNRQIGSTARFNLALATRHYLLEHLHNDLVCLGAARVDLKPHQVSVVHRVVTSYPHRFLLCDEVGLGKTIEAGMVLKELRARGHAQRALVIAPANLTRQWQFELKSKFNETFSIINTDTVRHVRNQGHRGNPFEQFDSVIVSSSWVTGERWSDLVRQCDWDMIIVDEAHHARGPRDRNKQAPTRLYQLIRDLADPGSFGNRAVLLLTATPMQLAESELYSLIEILDPALFPTFDHFIEHRDQVPGLNRLVEGLRDHGFPIPGTDAEDTVTRVAHWLDIDEALARKRLVEDPEGVCDDLAGRHLLSEVLIRNRKAVVGGFMPRVAVRWPVTLSREEHAALELVEDYVLEGHRAGRQMNDNAVGFLMVTFQQLMASSLRALARSLRRRRARLAAGVPTAMKATAMEERIVDEDGTVEEVADATTALAGELEHLDELIEVLEGIPTDSKAEALVANLRTLFEDDPDGKVLVFTQFRDTQDYLAERLAAEGWGVHTFHGQKSPIEKDRAVDGFRRGRGPQILVSTEAGGEGRNFQFCHVLVNYDLPWNPMRVEQRIGRIDRIGQTETVKIFNLYAVGTIEERILEILERRIDAFERTIGGLDPILGETEKDLRRILQRARKERDAALAELGERLEEQVAAARRAEEQLRDFIMDTKSFSKEIAERVTGRSSPVSADDQERFVTALLADARTWIGPYDGEARQLAFHEPLLSELPDEFVAGNKKLAVFRPDQLRDSEHVEFFALGHPIVDHVVERVLQSDYEGCTGTRRLPAGDDLPPGAGWLFVYEVEVSGLRPYRRLLPVFVDDEGRADVERGWALVRRSTRFRRDEETAVPFEEIPLDELDIARDVADRVAESVEHDERVRAAEDADEWVERERARLSAWFDYRERAAADRLAATDATLERLRGSEDQGQRRIIPVWEANLARDRRLLDELRDQRRAQLDRVDRMRDPAVSATLVAVGRIEVTQSGGARVA